MKVRTICYYVKEASKGLHRNRLMSLTSIMTIMLSLLILGYFYIIVSNCNHFAEMAKSVLEVRVYLEKDVDPIDLQTKIIKVPGVADVSFVSKEDGAKWLEKNLGVKDLYVMDDNPLPDMINIKLDDDVNLDKLVGKLRQLSGVEEVVYGKNFVKMVLIVERIAWIAGIALLILVGVVVLYIINNTIRLTVFARRKEIEIMKLVGATDGFIRWPFILEGIFLGLGGAIIALLILSRSYVFLGKYLEQSAPFLQLLSEKMINGVLLWLIPTVGLAFGMLGGLLSIKKFLRI